MKTAKYTIVAQLEDGTVVRFPAFNKAAAEKAARLKLVGKKGQALDCFPLTSPVITAKVIDNC